MIELSTLKFDIDKENIFGLVCGLFMVLLSMAMALFTSEISSIILRDILMILFLGFFTPTYYILIIKKKDLSVFGIHTDKLTVSLAINVVAGISLLAMFISKNTGDIVFNINSFYAITYIFVAGIFEMVFIYGFLRYEFERAFGVLPAIFITAIFYSLHHAGFQPEFTKLFFVGVMYVIVFYFTHNIFSIFPFFWGIGAVWDVLVNSEAGNQIKNETSFVIAMLMFIEMIVYTFFTLAPEAASIAELPVFMGVSAISAYCITSRFITFHHIFLLPKVVKAVVNSSVNQAVSRSISSRAEV